MPFDPTLSTTPSLRKQAAPLIAQMADHERQVLQNQRDQQRAEQQRQRENERNQQQAAKAQQQQANIKAETNFRATGREFFTNAAGDIVPKVDDATHAAQQAQAKQRADLEVKYKQEGRKFTKNAITGDLVPLESDAVLADRRQQEAENLRREALSSQMQSLQAEAALQPGPMRTKERAALEKQLKETRNGARFALAPKLQEKATAVTGGNDFIPFNESPAPEAETAKARLERLAQPDAQLDDTDLADLEADPTTAPTVAKLRTLQQQLAADDEARNKRSQTGQTLKELALRKADPAKWEAYQREKLAKLDGPALDAHLANNDEALMARTNDLAARQQALMAPQQQWQQKRSELEQQNQQAKASGIPAGELVNLSDGSSWHAPLAKQLFDIQAQQQAHEGDLEVAKQRKLLEIDMAEFNREAKLHQEAAQLRQQKAQQTEKTLADVRRFTPGFEKAAQQIAGLTQDAQARMAVVAEMYPQDGPERQAAVKAIQDDVTAQSQVAEAQGQQTQAAVTAAYQGIKQRLYENPKLNAVAGDLFLTARKNLSQSLGISEDEANNLLEDAESQDWSSIQGKHGETVPDGDNFQRFLTEARGDKRQFRLLKNGGLMINPVITDPEAYRKAVEASPASPEAKAAAMAVQPDLRKRYGAQALETLTQIGDSGWEKFKSAQPNVSQEEAAALYADKLKAETGTGEKVVRAILMSMNQGVGDIGAQALGLAAGMSGSETLMKGATALNERAQLIQADKLMRGAAGNFALNTAGQFSRIVPSLIPAFGAARGAQTSLALFARTGIAARLMPGLVAGLKAASSPAQAAKAAATFTQAGVAGAALAGGAQTYGAQLADIYSTLRREHPEMDHSTALRQAQIPAILSGAMTSLLTVAGGATGVEKLLANPAAVKDAFKKQFASRLAQAGFVAKAVALGGAKELPEEIADELFSTVASAVGTGQSVPQAIAQFAESLPELSAAILLLGGLGEGTQAARESSVQPPQTTATDSNQPQTAPTPVPPEVTAAAWAAIENLDLPGVDPAEVEPMQTRAAVALAVAQGGSLEDMEEAQLNAVGWTGRNNKGQTLPPGKIEKLKDYTGPEVLEVDTAGNATVAPSYRSALEQYLPAVAQAIQSGAPAAAEPSALGSQPSASPLSPEPAQSAQKPASSPAGMAEPQQPRGSSGQGPAPAAVDAGGEPQAGAGAVSSAPAAGQPSPTTANDSQPPQTSFKDGTPEAERSTQLATHLNTLGLPPEQAALVADHLVEKQGVKGPSYLDQVVSNDFPKILRDLGITGSLAPTQSQSNPLRAPADLSQRLAKSREQRAESQKPAPVPQPPAPVAPPSALRSPPKPKLDLVQEDRAQQLAAKITRGGAYSEEEAVALAEEYVAQSGENLRPLEQQWRQGMIPWLARRETAARGGRLAKGRAAVENIVASTPDRPADLRAHPAWTRNRLAALSSLPADRRPAARLQLNALERALAQNHALFTTLALGPKEIARTIMGDGSMAVQEMDGQIVLALDLGRLLDQMKNTTTPEAGMTAALVEEAIHAAVLRLAKKNPGKYGLAALVKRWQSLTPELRQKVWESYHAVDIQNGTHTKTIPTDMKDGQQWALMNEFLRMLVQDKAFAGQVSEIAAQDKNLAQWIVDALKDLAQALKDLISKASPEVQAELTSMVDEIALTVQQFSVLSSQLPVFRKDTRSAPTANREQRTENLVTTTDNRTSVLSGTSGPSTTTGELPAVRGSTGTAYTDANVPIEYQWAVMDVSDLSISNRDDGSVNPDYPQELQPRERNSAASEAQVADIAKNFNLDRLSISSSVGDGAPMISSDGVVESGNGRAMGSRRAYATRNAASSKYRDALISRAGEFGLDAEQVKAVKNPVLVRIRLTEVNRLAFVRAANVSNIAPKRELEQAKIDAAQIEPKLFTNFVPSEDGEIVTKANADFIRDFVSSIIPPNERGVIMDVDGNLTLSGLRRLRNALFVYAYGDSADTLAALGAIAEDIEADGRNTVNTLIAIAPRFAEQNGRIAKGDLYPLSITADLAKALTTYRDIKTRGDTVESWAVQETLSFEEKPAPFLITLVTAIHEHRRRPRVLLAALDRYAKAVDAAGGETLFGDEPRPTREELFALATGKTFTQEEAEGWRRLSEELRAKSEEPAPAPLSPGSISQPSALSPQPPAPVSQPSALSPQPPAPVSQPSALSPQPPAPVSPPSALRSPPTPSGRPLSTAEVAAQIQQKTGLTDRDALAKELEKRLSLRPFAAQSMAEAVLNDLAGVRPGNPDLKAKLAAMKEANRKAVMYPNNGVSGRRYTYGEGMDPAEYRRYGGLQNEDRRALRKGTVAPTIAPKNALKLYRTLTKLQEQNGRLTAGQAQALEQAERSLGQLFLFDDAETSILKPAEDLVLESLTLDRLDQAPEQLSLFMGRKAVKPSWLKPIESQTNDATLSGDELDTADSFRDPRNALSRLTAQNNPRTGNPAAGIRQDAGSESRPGSNGAEVSSGLQTLQRLNVRTFAEGVKNIPPEDHREGQEHFVYLDRESGRAVKMTQPDQFGARGSLASYLLQMAEQNDRFQDDITIEGWLQLPGESGPRLIISQSWITGRHSTLAEIDTYMRRKGFQRAYEGAWWDGTTVVSDALPKNFVTDFSGHVHPIDLIMVNPRSQNRIDQLDNQVAAQPQPDPTPEPPALQKGLVAPDWPQILAQVNDMTVQEFAALAATGKLNQATGQPSPFPVGSMKTPLAIGAAEGYPLRDIAHFYLARRTPRETTPAALARSAPDAAEVPQIVTAFDEFANDGYSESQTPALAKGRTAVNDGPDLFSFNTGLGLDALLTPAQKERKQADAVQLDLFASLDTPRATIPKAPRPRTRLEPTDAQPEVDLFSQPPPAAMPEPATAPEPEPAPSLAPTGSYAAKAAYLSRQIYAELTTDDQPLTWQQLFRMADDAFGGTQADGTYTPKDAYDAVEMAVNRWISERPGFDVTPIPDAELELERAQRAVRALKTITARLPTQSKRTEEMDDMQQFSTVPALAYMAAWSAGIVPTDIMLEPSAGVGGLAAFAKASGATVIANELSPRRASLLRETGIAEQVFEENAEQINNVLPADIRPTVVVMNPPFSTSPTGKKDTANAIKHIESALARLPQGGRLVAIVGEGMALDRPAFRAWWQGMMKKHHVRANVQVNGAEYAKYGTTWDNQLVVIDKVAPPGPPKAGSRITNPDGSYFTATGSEPAPKPLTGRVESIDELPALLYPIRNERPEISPSLQGTAGAGGPKSNVDTPRGSRAGAGTTGDTPDAGLGGSGNLSGGMAGTPDSAGTDTAASGPDRAGVDQTPPADPVQDGRPGSTPDSGGVAPQQAEIRASEEMTDAVYDAWQPRVLFPGAKAPPTNLAESAAMAAVDPPATSYRPSIPTSYYADPTRGDFDQRLATHALESIALAGNAHQQQIAAPIMPPNEREEWKKRFGTEPPESFRRGFFIGDGTGAGKGRQIAGIMFDNWNQGRKKAVWISEPNLFPDAKRDLNDVANLGDKLFAVNDTKAGEKLARGEGVGFISYSTLRSKEQKPAPGKLAKTRVDQIVEWLGADFDGVIAFDEAHNMGSAMEMKGSRGNKEASQQALAGLELQQRLPNARVVYLSATGATEVSNLAYAERLGLWGPGTPFRDRSKFVAEISAGGVAAMELIAQNLKAMGLYVARSISWHDVSYGRASHALSPEQRQIYDDLAEAWQKVLNNMDEAMKVTGITSTDPETGNEKTNNSAAKSAIRSKFWGGHQRFFNQLITAMKLPTVITAMERELAADRSIVIQLVNTQEASLGRAIDKAAATAADSGDEIDLENLDLSPRDQLLQLVQSAFPVIQMETFVTTDSEGNERTGSRPALDSKGNPILNQEAVAMRDALLDKLASTKVPSGPLEILLDHFGADKIAEVTGRTKRVVWKKDKDGRTVRSIEKRSVEHGKREAADFQDGARRILVFSKAGGTGRSFHADRRAKNQQKRVHILLQPGWQASAAVQGFGRTHRNNQVSTPHYLLAETDIVGEKRFMSSIARRLDQLGALTKGQRQTGSQGFFQARDNLESLEAKAALESFYTNVLSGSVPTISPDVLEKQMGLKLRDKEGQPLQDKPPITQFLNRLLSLKLDLQQAVFDAFSERLDAIIETKLSAGTLDLGLENVTALRTVENDRQTVYEDAQSGAKAELVSLTLTQPTKRTSYDSVQRQLADSSAQVYPWARSKRTGKLFAMTGMRNMTMRDGSVETAIRATGVTRAEWMPVSAFNKRYERVQYERENSPTMKAEWEQQYEAAPATEDETMQVLTGTMLPIWDKIPGTPRIVRAQTEDGRRMIGRVIPDDMAEKMVSDLTGKTAVITPAKAVEMARNGDRVRLSNGWTFKTSRLSGETRYELIGPGFTDHTLLDAAGVMKERIQFNMRYFLPTGKVEEVLAQTLTSFRATIQPEGPALAKGRVSVDTPANEATNQLDRRTAHATRIAGARVSAESGQALRDDHFARLLTGALRPDSPAARSDFDWSPGPRLAALLSEAFSAPILTPAQQAAIQSLPVNDEGVESIVYLDRQNGVIYKKLKNYAENPSGGIWPQVTWAGRSLSWSLQPANNPRAVGVRLAVMTDLGGTPTEVAAISPDGHIYLKQPLSSAPNIATDKGSHITVGTRHLAGLVEIPDKHLEPGSARAWIGIVNGRPWLVTDLHPANFIGDNQGNARINDPVIGVISMDVLKNVPGLGAIVQEANRRAQELGDRANRLFMSNKAVDSRPGTAQTSGMASTDGAAQSNEPPPGGLSEAELKKLAKIQFYHGSPYEWTEFDFAKIGARTGNQGIFATGQNWTTSKENALGYGRFITSKKRIFTNPLVIQDHSIWFGEKFPSYNPEWTGVSNVAAFTESVKKAGFDGVLIVTSRQRINQLRTYWSEAIEPASTFAKLPGSELRIVEAVSFSTKDNLDSLTSPRAQSGTLSKGSVSPSRPVSGAAVSQSPSPLAKLGWNHLDRSASAKLAALTRWTNDTTKAGELVAKWQAAPLAAPFMKWGHVLKKELFPDSVLPREIAAKKREMEIKTAMGGQRAMDLVRALSGSPKFSDIAYPPEFAANPVWRTRLYTAMTGETPMSSLPAPLQALAAKLRAMLVEIGQEAVKQGRMDADTFEMLREGYMPHYYKEDVAREKSLIQRFRLAVRDLLGARTSAWHIVDTQNRERGTGDFRAVEWQPGKWRFRNKEHRDAHYEDFILSQALTQIHAMGGKARTLTVSDLRAPAALSGEVRGALDVIKRQLRTRYQKEAPLSLDAHQKAGLIMDPVYAIARYAAQQAHDNSTAEFFNFVAADPQNISDVPAAGFTEVPDNPRYGRLAGKYVTDDVAHQILEMIEVPGDALRAYDTILGWWKTGKTVLNPGTHVRNVLGNVFFSQLAGNSVWNPGNTRYYRDALRAMRNGGPDLQEAYNMGVLGADFVSVELRQTLRQLLPDPATIEEGKPVLGIGKSIGQFAAKVIGNPAHKAYNQIAALYQAEDEIFKLAAYLKAKDMAVAAGVSTPSESARDHVRHWFPYFDSGSSTTLRTLGRTAMPFLGFYRESIRIFGHALAERPLALAAGLAVPSIITALSAMALGLDDDELDQVKKDMRGKAAKLLGPTPLGGMPLFSMLLPVRSDQGQLQQFDISAIHPFVDFMGNRVEGGENEDWYQKAWRSFIAAGPIGSLIYSQMTGKDTFGDRQFVEPNMSTSEKIVARVGNAWTTAVPPLLGSGLQSLMSAGERTTNKTFETRDPTQTVLRSVVGLDVRNATPNLYRIAEDWRKANGYEVQEGMDYGSTTPASRARRALFAQIAQDEPNLTAIANIKKRLAEMGHPITSEQDVNKLLFYRDPLKVIGGDKKRGISAKEAQQQFQASLTGLDRETLAAAQAEYQKIKARAPMLLLR